MCFWHDWPECRMPDYTPHCDISPEDKSTQESAILLELREFLWEKYHRILDKVWEYQLKESNDAKECSYIDKCLAGVWALEYKRLGYPGMDDFHPYVLNKIKESDYHTHLYKTLLDSKFDIDFFYQYELLLKLWWDRKKFYDTMQK